MKSLQLGQNLNQLFYKKVTHVGLGLYWMGPEKLRQVYLSVYYSIHLTMQKHFKGSHDTCDFTC